MNGGTCHSGINEFGLAYNVCQDCLPGFKGDNCEIKETECIEECGFGVCNTTTRKCVCNPGYTGDTCNQVDCEDKCQNDGKCIHENVTTAYCLCKGGYFGSFCEHSKYIKYCTVMLYNYIF